MALGTRLTISSAGRHRPYPGRPRGQAFNGLANSIWAGTKNPAASVKWVEYLTSADCQGVDVSAFTTHVKDSTTFLLPITDNSAKVYGLMGPAMDAVMSGKKAAPAP